MSDDMPDDTQSATTDRDDDDPWPAEPAQPDDGWPPF